MPTIATSATYPMASAPESMTRTKVRSTIRLRAKIGVPNVVWARAIATPIMITAWPMYAVGTMTASRPKMVSSATAVISSGKRGERQRDPTQLLSKRRWSGPDAADEIDDRHTDEADDHRHRHARQHPDHQGPHRIDTERIGDWSARSDAIEPIRRKGLTDRKDDDRGDGDPFETCQPRRGHRPVRESGDHQHQQPEPWDQHPRRRPRRKLPERRVALLDDHGPHRPRVGDEPQRQQRTAGAEQPSQRVRRLPQSHQSTEHRQQKEHDDGSDVLRAGSGEVQRRLAVARLEPHRHDEAEPAQRHQKRSDPIGGHRSEPRVTLQQTSLRDQV